MSTKIIDFHAHAFPEKIAVKAIEQLSSHYNLKINNRGELKNLLKSSFEGGVDKIVLHAAATNKGQVRLTNNWIAEVISDKIIGFGSIHPDYKNFEKELDRMEKMGLKGIKLHPEFQGFDIDDPRMMPIYDAIEDRFIVMFHVGDRTSLASSPEKLARVLDKFPRLKAVAAHLGGWSMWDSARKHLIGRDIYIDTSSTSWCLDQESIVEIIKSHGVDKVVFGTDYPICNHKEEIEFIKGLSLSEEEKEMIFWKNAEVLLGLCS